MSYRPRGRIYPHSGQAQSQSKVLFTMDGMNQKICGSLTAALLITTLGATSASYAGQPQAGEQGSESAPPQEEATPEPSAANLSATLDTPEPETSVKMGEQSPESDQPATLPVEPAEARSTEPVKVGEEQSSESKSKAEAAVIAKLHPHEISGRQAVTLYVRNIPVLTFLGSRQTVAIESKQGQVDSPESTSNVQNDQLKALFNQPTTAVIQSVSEADASPAQDDPVWRAAEIAAKLNQLNLGTVDADTITVGWRAVKDASGAKRDRYTVKVNGKDLVELDGEVMLPDTTKDPEKDALHITNRLRRLVANAQPLREIPGKPKQPKVIQIAVGNVRQRLSGLASWYGPGFHGNMSASGEPFNQHAMTAAHRYLPFGTRVRVVNLYNGKSVVVRINDRGPFSPGRIIDLSAGAASALGLIQSGVAPVRLEVLGSQRAVAVGN
jgi:rare lipoprotein A